MPLFNCSKCNCVENTACGRYWGRKEEGKPALCSECNTGAWHDKFPKRSAVGMLVDQDGFLWGADEKAAMPARTRIVGTVAEDGSITMKEPDNGNR